MDGRIEALGSNIQKSIERVSNEGFHSIAYKLTKEDSEIIDIIKSKLIEAGFKVTLRDELTISW